ncbi:hypothetical protein BaRGS_00034550 [Batillaria attramentaria]|uniref:Uncharacterized protein n=1 Tax=Batillaria attramentaria TaxID=370345 RepID=A0ABD0JH69_9CAEN
MSRLNTGRLSADHCNTLLMDDSRWSRDVTTVLSAGPLALCCQAAGPHAALIVSDCWIWTEVWNRAHRELAEVQNKVCWVGGGDNIVANANQFLMNEICE